MHRRVHEGRRTRWTHTTWLLAKKMQSDYCVMRLITKRVHLIITFITFTFVITIVDYSDDALICLYVFTTDNCKH